MAESESRSESRVCATQRSQARAAATAVASCARPTVVSSSARFTEKDSQPRTSSGTKPTTARTRKTRDRKGKAALAWAGKDFCHCKEGRRGAATERLSAPCALLAPVDHFSLTFRCPDSRRFVRGANVFSNTWSALSTRGQREGGLSFFLG